MSNLQRSFDCAGAELTALNWLQSGQCHSTVMTQGLLFRRMIVLQIDRRELAREEPLLLRELQGLCTLCGSKPECVQDLRREYETGEPQTWEEYCPNAATLNAIGTLQNCPRVAQCLNSTAQRDGRLLATRS